MISVVSHLLVRGPGDIFCKHAFRHACFGDFTFHSASFAGVNFEFYVILMIFLNHCRGPGNNYTHSPELNASYEEKIV